MYSKEMVLNNCYQELSDVMLDLLKYEFSGVTIENEVFNLMNNMLVDCQDMIDNINDYEWSDIMKVKTTYYQVARLVNVLLINQYDKIITHKNR